MEENTIAQFRYVKTGNIRSLKTTYDRKGLYLYWEDYKGLFAYGATQDANQITIGLISDGIKEGDIEVIKSPASLYHRWHICECEDCQKWGGRVFDHSQGSFNDHLRYVPNDRIFTFPTITEKG